MGIDKYMNVLVNPNIVERNIRLHYLQSEATANVAQIRHPLAREALRMHGIEQAMTITSVADLPARAGVGSSGSYLVAILAALRAYTRRSISPDILAEEACHIEIDLLKEPVGKQDQYMAAFGGLRVLEIGRDGKVETRTIDVSPGAMHALAANMHIYYTGVERSASAVLEKQNAAAGQTSHENHRQVVESLLRIKDFGYRILDAVKSENFDDYGQLLDEHWQSKKQMSSKISLQFVDEIYETAKAEYGVLGGKIIGAGGGGFLMLYAPRDHRRLSDFMLRNGMRQLHYSVEYQGAKIVADLRASHEAGVNHRAEAELCTHP